MTTLDKNIQQQGSEMTANNNSPRVEVGHNIYILPHALDPDNGVSAKYLSGLFGKNLLRTTMPHTVTAEDLANPEKVAALERAAKNIRANKQTFWRQS